MVATEWIIGPGHHVRGITLILNRISKRNIPIEQLSRGSVTFSPKKV